jgi:hypothetical protein
MTEQTIGGMTMMERKLQTEAKSLSSARPLETIPEPWIPTLQLLETLATG